MANNFIEEVSQKVGNLKSLEELNLAENRLDRIPSEIGLCTKLKSLMLHKNRLGIVPKAICVLQNLEAMSLEWFMYLDPPQQPIQKETQARFLISQF